MSGDHILVLDAGTTSTRAVLYRPDGAVVASAQRAIRQHYPRSGWVEQDANEIWTASLACLRDVVAQGGGVDRVAAVGIANQRETVVAWDKRTGAPLAHAIVWQDRRTADVCTALREGGHEAAVQAKTGLILDPYFSATKMRWLIDHAAAVAGAGDALALGTVESWLLWKLTGGCHMSDASNASRTQLLALDGAGWDSGLCALFGVPMGALGEVVDNHGAFGACLPEWLGAAVPICGLAGDQQAATIGQGCLSPGDTKATFGTGAFVLTNRGTALPRSGHRLLGTVLCQSGGVRQYALEGSIFVAGSLIQWLRDALGLIATAEESEALARSVPDSGGVVVVPALSGLGAPHWRPDARGVIAGISHGTGRAHIVRAALEAMAHQVHDLQGAFAADGAAWASLRIDGGMSANDWMAQDLADILNLPVERPADIETTARGAAMLAGTGCGLFASLEAAVAAMRGDVERFMPDMAVEEQMARLAGWRRVLG